MNKGKTDMADSKKDSTKQLLENEVQKERSHASNISADSFPSNERPELVTPGHEPPVRPSVTRQKAAVKRTALSSHLTPTVPESSNADSTEAKTSSDTESSHGKKLVSYAVSSPTASAGNEVIDDEMGTLRKQQLIPERSGQVFDYNGPPNRFVPPYPVAIGVTSGHPNSSANKHWEKINDEDADVNLRYHPVRKSSPMVPLMDTTLRTCSGLYKCRICSRVFSNRFSLTGHYRSHYDTRYVIKHHHCQKCGQGCASPSGLLLQWLKNCNVLRSRNQKDQALLSVYSHSTSSPISGPMGRSYTESKRKCIKTKQTEKVRKTHLGTLRRKFAGKFKIEEPIRENAEEPDSSERAYSPVDLENAYTDDDLSKHSQIQQSVGMTGKTSSRIDLRALNLPGSGGSDARSHSKNSPGNKKANTAAQAHSGKCIRIPHSWNQRDKEAQMPGWLKLTYQETAPSESSESSLATGKIQQEQVPEQVYQLGETLQQIFAIASDAILAAFPSINSTKAHPLWAILHSAHSAITPVNRNYIVLNSKNQCIPSISEPVHANSLRGDVHGNIKPTFAALCPTGRPFYPFDYLSLCRLTDARAPEKQLSLTPSSQHESLRLRQPSGARVLCLSEDRHTFSPGSPCSHSLCCNFPSNNRCHSSSANTSASDISGVNVANYTDLVKLSKCERNFSTFATCWFH